MRASKKMIEGFAVAGLAVALTVTTLTTNGGSAATERMDTTESGLSGVAGISATVNEYETEALQGQPVGVERGEVNIVAASAEGAASDVSAEGDDTSAFTDNAGMAAEKEIVQKEELTPEEEEWQDKLMAKVDEFLNVRAEPDTDAEIVGKLRKGDRALVKKKGDEWTKIASGNVVGYVKNEYCVYGVKALKYARKNCDTVATSTVDGLRVRREADTEAGVVKTLGSGEKLVVDTKAETVDGWVAVKADNKTCYVSADYVEVKLNTGKAITIEEERKAQEEAAKKAASSGQTKSAGTVRGESLAATADEETLLAAIIQCEVGGCGMECMKAVGAVVVNRVKSSHYPNNIRDVIFQRCQFTPAGNGLLERRLRNGVSADARRAAQAALAGEDPTGGAIGFRLASSGHSGVVIGPVVFF